MRKVVLKMDMSLDGYVGPLDEDAEWLMRHFDDELSQWVVDEVLWKAGTHVMGRHTYEEMAATWPTSDAVFAAPMNEIPKVVFSRTLESADWPETRIASGRPDRGDLAPAGGSRETSAGGSAGCCAAGPARGCWTGMKPSAGRSPSTPPRGRRTPPARSARPSRRCAPTSAAGSPTSGPENARRSTCSSPA
jgi:dihydrofolate reductase